MIVDIRAFEGDFSDSCFGVDIGFLEWFSTGFNINTDDYFFTQKQCKHILNVL